MNKIGRILKEQMFLIAGFITVIVAFVFTYDVPFFGDAISKSIRANFFYENNFLPEDPVNCYLSKHSLYLFQIF